MSKKPINHDSTNQELKSLDLKNHDIKLEDAKKPQNLRANAMPIDGFVLSVDGKLKTHYENSEDATAAATKLKQRFPVIQVKIYDASARAYTPVELEEQK